MFADCVTDIRESALKMQTFGLWSNIIGWDKIDEGRAFWCTGFVGFLDISCSGFIPHICGVKSERDKAEFFLHKFKYDPWRLSATHSNGAALMAEFDCQHTDRFKKKSNFWSWSFLVFVLTLNSCKRFAAGATISSKETNKEIQYGGGTQGGNAKKLNLKTNWPTERSEGAAASTRTQDTLEIWSNGSLSLFYILSFWGDLYFLIPYVFLHLNMIQNILNIENEWNVHQPCASWPQELCNGALPFHLIMFAFYISWQDRSNWFHLRRHE